MTKTLPIAEQRPKRADLKISNRQPTKTCFKAFGGRGFRISPEVFAFRHTEVMEYAIKNNTAVNRDLLLPKGRNGSQNAFMR